MGLHKYLNIILDIIEAGGLAVLFYEGWIREQSINKIVGALDDTFLTVAMAELVRVLMGKLDDGITVLDSMWRMANVFKLDMIELMLHSIEHL